LPAPLRRRITRNPAKEQEFHENVDIAPLKPTKTSEDSSQRQSSQQQRRLQRLQPGRQAPLVVFPALPIAPIEPSHRAPLSWFMVPVIRAMDRNKKLLAEMYPGLVVFVESPSQLVMSQTEDRKGPLWESGNADVVLLQLADDKLENSKDKPNITELLMRQHYHSWFVDAEEDEEDFRRSTTITSKESNQYDYEIQTDGVKLSMPGINDRRASHPGASLVSCDGVHPNDSG
jgi:hypothetical protein